LFIIYSEGIHRTIIYIRHETAICRNLPIHSLTEHRRKLTDSQQINIRDVTFLGKYKEKQFYSGHSPECSWTTCL